MNYTSGLVRAIGVFLNRCLVNNESVITKETDKMFIVEKYALLSIRITSDTG
jgi:hypothetical protein